jgi:hypothetical protein
MPGLGDFCVREREINTFFFFFFWEKGYGVPVYMGVCSVVFIEKLAIRPKIHVLTTVMQEKDRKSLVPTCGKEKPYH